MRLRAFFIALFCYSFTYASSVEVTLAFDDSTLVNDTLFTVGDIADVKGSNARIVEAVKESVAGTSAPPGYGRFISTSDLAAYRLQTKFNGVTFTLLGSKRPLIRTDYREISLSTYENELRAYITARIRWKQREWEVTLINPAEKTKLFNSPVTVSFSGLDDSYPRGTTNLVMIARQGVRSVNIPVRCCFSVKAPVVVTKNAIARGEAVTAINCEIDTLDITRFAPAPYYSFASLQNKRAARSLKPGTIVHDRLLLNIPVIEKGDEVSIVFSKGRISVAVPAVAREQGSIGDKIWVENCKTHKLVRVEIRAKGIVSALQGGVSI